MDYFIDSNTTLNIWEVEKIQLYYIFKDLYNYEDKKIEEDFLLIIDNKFKNYNLELNRLISSENLLTQIFDDTADYPEWWVKPEPWYLSKKEILFLNDIFQLDVSKYDSVNLVVEKRWAYNSLDNEWKELFVKMLKTVFNNSFNISTKSTVWDFLLKYESVE